ncbi:MAG: hypothetical protein H0W72_16355, partial [Planctomycetes bacterium]|nr:hypothetical protein [Planctomycetota bacterium]
PDHVLVRDAARDALPRTVFTAFYEDMPYGARSDAAGATSGLGRNLVAVGAQLAAKCAAIDCYASQVPDLFGAARSVQTTVAEWAGSEQVERLWTPSAVARSRWLDRLA